MAKTMSDEVKIKVWKDKGWLSGNFLKIRNLALSMPGFKKFVNDSLMFELSGKNIEYLVNCNDSSLVWTDSAWKQRRLYKERVEKEEAIRKQKLEAIPEGAYDFQFKTVPFEHQKKAFILSKDLEYFGYFMEMGTGKTKVVIDVSAHLYSSNSIECLIIVAPNNVHGQWIDEQIPIHMPDWLLYESVAYKASNKNTVKSMEKLLNSTDNTLKIIAFNIESLSNKKGVAAIHSFLIKYRCLLVIDESSRIKTPGSLRTKAALKLAGLAHYRRIMSGAPITKGYEDLYSQLKFLHPDVLGFGSFYTFRNYYCIMGGFEMREIVGYRPNCIKELEAKMEAYSFRITKKECLTLPDKVYMTRFVDLTEEQKSIYKLLVDDFEAEINGGKINAPLAITKMLRMQQVICGHAVDDDEKIHDVPSNRLDVLIECVEEAQGKVIVWSRFIHDIKKISLAMNHKKIRHRTYYGEVKQADREIGMKAFKEDPSVKVFLGQPASGGTGLNLQEATTVIYYSNDFNADTRWQSEDRAHRIGQKNKVTYIDIIAKNSIDIKILQALRSKKNLADALLDNPRQFLMKT